MRYSTKCKLSCHIINNSLGKLTEGERLKRYDLYLEEERGRTQLKECKT
jgi:hypothetical protein